MLFLITFVTSIPAYLLFQSVLDDPAGYIAGGGKDNQIYLGAFLELLLIIANVGTAVVLYPIARRQSEILALGYVAARIIECVFLAAGIIFVLGVVSLRQDSPDAADLAVSLAALKDWTFLFGPGLIVPFGNGLILGYLMYKSGLVPRRMAWLGLIGGPLLLISEHRHARRLVGRRRHGAGHPRNPRVLVGVVARDLLRPFGDSRRRHRFSGTIGAPSRKQPDSCGASDLERADDVDAGSPRAARRAASASAIRLTAQKANSA